ncbi:MAG: CvpA family protein [Tannerellaceae bacterium]|nr:CvpA family protein [Tannerellaceae bacterium]
MNTNWLDIILLCLAGIGLLKGLFDGFIKQVVSLIALFAAIFLCGKVAGWLSEYIIQLGWFTPGSITVVSYVFAFLLIVTILVVAGKIVHRIIGATPLSLFNHLAGGLFGILVVVLFSSLILNILDTVERYLNIIPAEVKIESKLYYPVKEVIPKIYSQALFSFSEEE